MAGGLNGQVIIVHAVEGRLTLRVERTIGTPMLECSDSAGNSFVIVLDQYEKASHHERAQFYAAMADAIRAEAAKLN